MRKIIKKIVHFLGWTLFLLFIIGIALSILVNTNMVQSRIVDTAFSKLGDRFGNVFAYSKVKVRLVNRVEVNDLLITDLDNDTLIFAPEFSVHVPGLLRKILFDKEKPIKIGSLNFKDSYFRLYNDADHNINLRFFIDSLKALKDTAKDPNPIFFNKINIKDSRFALFIYDTVQVEEGIDFSRMVFDDLNVTVKDLKVFADTVQMGIKKLAFVDRSGFEMKSFKAGLHLCQSHMHFENIEMGMRDSDIELDKVHFDFNDFEDFADGGVFDKVKMNIEVMRSDINMLDVAYFARFFSKMDQQVKLSGRFYGYLSNFNARNLYLSAGNRTLLKGRFDISGLPDASNTFLYCDINEFSTDVDDINNMNLPRGNSINLPDYLSNIKNLTYQGNFTGFFRDFVSYGIVRTEHGAVMADVLFEPDSNNLVTFSGNVQSDSFDIGVLTNFPEVIGRISLNMDVDGQGKIDGGFDVDMSGNIGEFEVNAYNYSNIQVDGNFSENRFNGKLEIDDKNAKVEFDGLVDLSSEVRQYVFNANVLNANLYNLNFHKRDSNYVSSFLINADLNGNTLNDLNGKVKLLNSLFANSEAQIQVYDLQLDIKNDSLENRLEIKSDFLDGMVEGKFNMGNLHSEYLSYVNKLLPSLSINPDGIVLDSTCDFQYDLHFKNCLPVFNFFIPHYKVYPRTTAEGTFRRDSLIQATLHLESPQVFLDKNNLKSVVLNAANIVDTMYVDLGCQTANFSKRIELDNFTVNASIDSNNIDFQTSWMNWDSLLYKGNIDGKISLLNSIGEKLRSTVKFEGSELVINDTVWEFKPCEVLYDSVSLVVNGFRVQHKEELIELSGALTENAADSLYCSFKNFDFINLNNFTRSEKFQFGGILDGEVVVKGFEKPLFMAEMTVEDLELNQEMIGNTYVGSRWDNVKESLILDVDVYRGKLNTLKVDGNIYPARNSEIDMNIDFNKFRLDFVNPYLDNIFDDIQGLATGTVLISGSTNEPKLNGGLNLQKAALTVDYLKTRYTFTSSIGMTNNNLVFNNILMNDKFGNEARFNGLIQTGDFKNLNLNLSINADKFLFLDTKSSDNQYFYGTAFASGLVRMTGEPSNLKFDVTARTEKGTEFNIPLSDSEELAEYTFIKFIEQDSINEEIGEVEYNVNLAGMQLDFDLKVTPDANVKIIFDETMGDIIEATGSGDMRIAINELNDLKIVGEYLIEEGDYLFTLEDVLINRKFKVEGGSSLRWTGDPVNANIDINTYYRTKASLSDLDYIETDIGNKTVDCQLELTGYLTQPNVGYEIYLPFAEQETRDWVATRITTEEEKGKQFLSLLILNKFMYSATSQNEDVENPTNIMTGVQASELLSNQLSNWLSQISDDFDIGVSYKPGTEISSQEVEVALSTQMLNDRLSINGSVDMKTNAETDEANSIVGDVDIDYKITKNGKIRARAFNRANEGETVINMSKYTQGIGVFYTEEFDEFGDIIENYRKNKAERKSKNKHGESDPGENPNANATRNDEEEED